MTLKAMREPGMTPERAAEISRWLHEAARPYVQMKLHITAVAHLKIFVCDGEVTSIQYDRETQALLDIVDDLWREDCAAMAFGHGILPGEIRCPYCGSRRAPDEQWCTACEIKRPMGSSYEPPKQAEARLSQKSC